MNERRTSINHVRWYVRAIAITMGALMLSFPVWLNGAPYLFHDSDAYYRNGRSVISKLGVEKPSGSVAENVAAAPPTAQTTQPNLDITLLSARSPYYGVLLYASSLIGGLWGIVIVQAYAAAGVIWFAVEVFAAGRVLSTYLAMCLTLALGSSLPWFVSLVMPDIWLSVVLLFFGVLVFGLRRPSLASCLVLTALVAAAGAFHLSNVAVIALSLPLAIIIAAYFGASTRHAWSVSAWALFGLILSIAAGWFFGFAAQRHFGQPLRSPIFATARVLADGPGRVYLRAACANDPTKYSLCKYRTLPLDDADAILWSPDPRSGVYTASNYDTRVALSNEQWRFVTNTVLFDPARAVVVVVTNALSQATRFRLGNFDNNLWKRWSGDPYWSRQPILDLIPKASLCLTTPDACEPSSSIAIFDWVQRIAFIASSAFLIWQVGFYLVRGSNEAHTNRGIVGLSAFVLLDIAINAAICGVFSGPSDRYQARITWLSVAIATLILLLRRFGRNALPEDSVGALKSGLNAA